MVATTVAEARTYSPAARDSATREQVIIQHTGLVKYVIGRLAVQLPQVLDYDDLLAYGTIGLIQAYDRFDPTRGVKFESFAVMRIRGAILDALRSLRGLPQSVTDKAKRLRQAGLELEAELGHPPSDEELARALGMSVKEVQQQLLDASCVNVSLDAILDSPTGGDATAFASPHRESDVAGTVERREQIRELSDALKTLSEREQLLLNLYYKEELTMREIGQVLEISEGRVCQIHAKALHKLRVAIARQAQES
jgi:RNA polymerase sigma factor FliA